jgi:hypothetical protein
LVSQFVQDLEPWISHERFEAYRPNGGDDLAMAVNYLHNVALCEALYTPLGFLEVTLRNSLHTSLSTLYGSSTWFSLPGILEVNDANAVAKISTRILGEGKAATADRIVSELNFGFWVALLSTPYDAKLWRPNSSRALKTSFPHVPKCLRRRHIIYRRYNELRRIRNRVFHHETIWNRVTLPNDYHKLCEAIGWISPEVGAACKLVDRFDHVRRHGRGEIETMLKAHLGIP